MNTYDDKTQENKKQPEAKPTPQKQHPSIGFVDNRLEATVQRKLQEIANKSPNQLLVNKNVIQRAEIWDEASVGFGAKTKLIPEVYAQNLTEESEEFATLRGAANEQTQKFFGKNLNYKSKPKKGGGTSEAYFKDDSAYFNMEGHPAMILSNIIFETANAAQSGAFIQVENDYKSGILMEKSIADYGFDDIGDALATQYEQGDGETRRSIIQERYEWKSFILAKPTFLKVKGEMQKNEKSKDMYDVYFAAFDHMLSMNSFDEYYEVFGHTHRKAVEGVLRKVAEQEKNKSKCYLTTACVDAKGLPDNCEELTVLRKFRDTYLLNKENGSALIEKYYMYSPKIVSVIKRREDQEDILASIYKIIRQCVDAIKNDDNEYAYHTYCEMVVALKNKYVPD